MIFVHRWPVLEDNLPRLRRYSSQSRSTGYAASYFSAWKPISEKITLIITFNNLLRFTFERDYPNCQID